MRIGSLFSGIGGLELGVSAAFDAADLGHDVAWQVELNPFCRSVLEQHWPEAERHEDVRQVGSHNLAPVSCIVAGFPCQDISSAGQGKGLAGSRSGLWYECARVIDELKPEWVIIENVASGARKWVDAVSAHLGELGYETLPLPVSAEDVGAPHLRRRVFLVAHSNRGRREGLRVPHHGGVERTRRGQPDRRGDPRQDRLEAPRSPTADARGEGLQGADTAPGPVAWVGAAECSWAEDTVPVPSLRDVDDGTPTAVVRRRRRARRDCLVALGNSVVPQCAEVAGWVVVELMRRQP